MENQAIFMESNTRPDHSDSPRSHRQQLIVLNSPRSHQQQCPNSSLIITDNNEDIHGDDHQHGDLDSFPPGYRFRPCDEELIQYYLRRKIKNLTLPQNKIHEVNIYQHNPDQLAEKYEAQGEKEWYFFTPRERKYPRGQRPSRRAGSGFWKATGSEKGVKFNGLTIGYKKTLVFYQGKPQNGNKTSWIMQEFTLDTPSNITQRDQNDMRLDDWVLCKIYKTEHKQAGKTNPQLLLDDGINEGNIVNSIAVIPEGTPMHNNITQTQPIEMEINSTQHGSGINENINEEAILRSSLGNSTAATLLSEETLMHNNMENFNTYDDTNCAFGYDEALETAEFAHETLGTLPPIDFNLGLPQDFSSLSEEPCLDLSLLDDIFPL